MFSITRFDVKDPVTLDSLSQYSYLFPRGLGSLNNFLKALNMLHDTDEILRARPQISVGPILDCYLLIAPHFCEARSLNEPGA